MSDLNISAAVQASAAACFVRGNLKDATGAVVQNYDAPVVNGHLAEDFLFRGVEDGSYTLECDVYNANGGLIQAGAFKAGPFHINATGIHAAVSSITASIE